ncbi:MAG TPA: hypothetical protein VNO81_15140 [Candidatus Nitrosotenuis sp.]|nr:hypothetical protein [Candidatus Nitrosotenuis sp.]
MKASLLLGGILLVAILLAAWGGWCFGRRSGENPLKMAFLAAGLLVGGALSAWWAWETDASMRRQTLFEVLAPGSSGVAAGIPGPLREMEFSVEHPGVEHDLLVAPVGSPGGPVSIEVELVDPQGRVLLDQTPTFEVRSRGRARNSEWQAWYGRFTPGVAGPHRLRLTLLREGIPQVHVRVGDPLKTDGHRIPGY